MSWIFFSLMVVLGFAILKVRRRRKALQAEVAPKYSDSAAA